jgi:hypothetical protein
MQSILLALGVYIFSNSLLKNSCLALLASVCAITARPYGFNIAWYAWIQWYPYPAECALGCMLIAAALFLRGSKFYSIPLFIAGMFHPLQGFYLAIIFCIFMLFQLYNKGRWISFFKEVSIIAIVVIAFSYIVLSPAMEQTSYVERTTENLFFDVVARSSHILTWIEHLDTFIPDVAFYLSILVIASFSYIYVSEKNKIFLFSLIFSGISLPVTHIFFTLICDNPINALSALILTRSSQIIILLALPYAIMACINFCKKDVFYNRILLSFAAVKFLLIMSVQNTVITGIAIAACSFVRHNLIKLVIIMICLLGYKYDLGVLFENSHTFMYMFYGAEFVSFGILAGLSIAVVLFPKLQNLCVICLICILGYSAILNTQYLGAAFTHTVQKKDRYDAQVWAKTHTPPGSYFLGLDPKIGSWRCISNRPLYGIFQIPSIAVYHFPEKAKLFFRNQAEVFAQLSGIPVEELYSGTYLDAWGKIKPLMDKKAYSELAIVENVTYYFSPIDKKLFDFPVLYANDTYSIQCLAPVCP